MLSSDTANVLQQLMRLPCLELCTRASSCWKPAIKVLDKKAISRGQQCRHHHQNLGNCASSCFCSMFMHPPAIFALSCAGVAEL
eukprot:6471019-Amphidinium_carterae.1